MIRSPSTKTRVFPRLLTVLALSALGLSAVGCGKKKNAAAPQPVPTPYPQYPHAPYPQPGVSPFPGMPIGPVVYPQPNQYCANAVSVPPGQPIPAYELSRLLTDGEGGCYRLVEVQQFTEVSQNGAVVSSSAIDTSIDYDLVRVGRKRRARVATRANVRSRNVCGGANASGSVSLPLWIDRDTGAIGQNLRLLGAGRWSIADNGGRYGIDAFVRASSGYGVQGMQAYRQPGGDLVLVISAPAGDAMGSAYARTLTRATYRADY